jgi:hypothetical protein
VANPNNKVERPIYNVEEGTFPTYSIVSVQDIHLRSGKTLHKESPILIEEKEKEEIPNKTGTTIAHKSIETQKDQSQLTKTHPFPERLYLEKYINPSEHDFLDELKNICVKIPLLQAIKNIPIYTKTIRELCLKKSGRKRKDPTIVQVCWKISR